MCPFCIASALSIAAGTASVGGVAALFVYARKLGSTAEIPNNPLPHHDEDE